MIVCGIIKRQASLVSPLTLPHNTGCLGGQCRTNTGHILEDFSMSKKAAAWKSNIHLRYVRWLRHLTYLTASICQLYTTVPESSVPTL